MSFSGDLLAGVAGRLDEAGAGAYRPPAGPYTADDVAIVFRVLPSAPDTAIALATYDLGNSFSLSDSDIGLQLLIRGAVGDPMSDIEIDDACFDVLHGAWAVDIGGVHVPSVARISGVSLGPDDRGRFIRTSNYRLQVHRPSPNRT